MGSNQNMFELVERSARGTCCMRGIVYRSRAMQRVCEAIKKTLDNDISVLIQGDTGTGKELVARAIHMLGSRKNQGFFSQNTGALPETLLESELFGHKRGAFSDARENKIGFFELADGATVFLDEIGEASPAFQVSLLRLLESGTFRRVGDTVERKTDVRIIAATNRDLKKEVWKGRFRADLYYRLCVFPIVIPPLRERKEDIPVLVNHFIKEINAQLNRPHCPVPPNTMAQLMEREWKGNVRELRNLIYRMLVVSPPGTLAIPHEETGPVAPIRKKIPRPAGTEHFKTLEEVQREHITHVLEMLDGNQTRAAHRLGLHRNTFRARMKKLGLSPMESNRPAYLIA